MSLDSLHSNGDDLDWKGKYIVVSKTGNVYFPIKCIGDGSFATVWMTYLFNKKMAVRKLVALKIFLSCNKAIAEKEYALYEKFKQMGIRNIIEIYDFFPTTHNDEQCICIAMEMANGSLFDLANNINLKNGFPVSAVIKIAQQLLETLSDMHTNNLIHCDIKPENILLKGMSPGSSLLLQSLAKLNNRQAIIKEILKAFPNDHLSAMTFDDEKITSDAYVANCVDETDSDFSSSSDEESNVDNSCVDDILQNLSVVLADFGSCVTIGSTEHNDVLSLVQTRYYKAPEVILCASYDTSSDIWSLGCTLYELLTGKLMFDTKGMRGTDKMRGLLHCITDTLGQIPAYIINEGLHKEVFYTKSYHQKGVCSHQVDNKIWINFLACANSTEKNTAKNALLLDLVLLMCKTDKKKRIGAQEALHHKLFTSD